MFETDEREALRARLVGWAEADAQIAAAATLGSAARGELDTWSDIDLALRLVPGVEQEVVADRWTALVAQSEPVVDRLDVGLPGALYRVLLLGSTLQVDLSFWRHDQPLAGGAAVAVLFGEFPVAPVDPTGEQSSSAVRRCWLYALHVRSALARQRWWQASWMLQSIRDEVTGLYCRRLGLPAYEGRGVDRLPADLLDGLARSHPSRIEAEELSSAFAGLVELLLDEAERHGVLVPTGLSQVLDELVGADAGRAG